MTEILRGEKLGAAADLLSDESRLPGEAEAVFQPANEADLMEFLSGNAAGERLTVSSGLTGIAGGGVPNGGVAVNFKKMNRVLGLRRGGEAWFVRCEPGVVLGDLREMLARKEFPGASSWEDESRAALEAFREAGEWIFPVDPTEWSACIGGMAACNASGARSYHYGAMRRWVESVRGVLSDGRAFALKREESFAGDGRVFSLLLGDGTALSGRLPAYRMPAVKNAAGYFAGDGMDLVDLLVGSEGTLAILTEVEVRLASAPESILGVICFAPSEAAALELVHGLRGDGDAQLPQKPLALEYFDHRALDLLRAHREEAEATEEIPDLPPEFHTAVYVEFAGSEESVDECAMELAELLETLGIDEDATWMATEAREHERLKAFRHAIPETVNLRIGQLRRESPGITKLGTDMAVPAGELDGMLAFYRTNLEEAGLDHVIFGHIGDSHVHVNILPRNEDEYARGKEIYLRFAKRAVDVGGTVSAEHGLGKLKTFLLPVLYGEDGVRAMRETKRVFDPEGHLNRGTLFEWANDSEGCA